MQGKDQKLSTGELSIIEQEFVQTFYLLPAYFFLILKSLFKVTSTLIGFKKNLNYQGKKSGSLRRLPVHKYVLE